MLYSIENGDDFEKLNKLVSLQIQSKDLRLQDKLGNQGFHDDMKKVFEPMTDMLKVVSNDITKTITDSSLKNNIALDNLKEKN